MGADTADNEVSRRRLLDVLLSGSLLAFLAAVFYPVARYLTPPKVQEDVASSVVAAQVDPGRAELGARSFASARSPGS